MLAPAAMMTVKNSKIEICIFEYFYFAHQKSITKKQILIRLRVFQLIFSTQKLATQPQSPRKQVTRLKDSFLNAGKAKNPKAPR
jgi:glutamine phosphoribosylpyrophosphate amidotransferase